MKLFFEESALLDVSNGLRLFPSRISARTLLNRPESLGFYTQC